MPGLETLRIAIVVVALVAAGVATVAGFMALALLALAFGCLLFFRAVDLAARAWHWVAMLTARPRRALGRGIRFVARPFIPLDRLLRRFSRGRRLGWPRWAFYLVAPPAIACTLLVSWALGYIYLMPGDWPDIDCVLKWEPLQIGNISDANGEIYFRMYDNEARRKIRYDSIPEMVQLVFTSAENADFWDNDGWNKRRTGIAALKAFSGKFLGYRSQGGSTITQQVDRRVDLVTLDLFKREKSERLISTSIPARVVAMLKGPVFANRTARKWREIKRSHRLEVGLEKYFRALGEPNQRRKAKESILALYLNAAYFGHGVYGVDYAAEFFFRKKLADLTVPEAAYLASLLPAPNRYAQLDGDLAVSKARRDQVLQRMAANGFLDRKQLASALATPLRLNVLLASTKTEAPAAVNTVLYRDLPEAGTARSELLAGSIQIRTTLRMDIQRIVNEAVTHGLYGNGKKGSGWAGRYPGIEIPQVAVVVLGVRGEILAMHGGEVRDPKFRYNAHMQLNRVFSLEQPGSTFKIVDSMAAIAAGFTPDTPVNSAPISVRMGNGTSKAIGNYEDDHLGVLPLREFSARSVNTAYMRLMRDMVGHTPEAAAEAAVLRRRVKQPVDAGAAWAIKWAREMGITTELQPYISTVLGGSEVTVMDMANVIHSAGTGQRAVPYIVSRITNNDGHVLYENNGILTPLPVTPDKIILEKVLLYGNVRLPKGTGHSLDTAEFGIEVGGKTGTSNDWRDAWYAGWTEDGLYIAVHLGYDNNKSLPGEGLPIWQRASGGWVALPIFREIMEKCYGPERPMGIPHQMPAAVKDNVNAYLAATYQVPAK